MSPVHASTDRGHGNDSLLSSSSLDLCSFHGIDSVNFVFEILPCVQVLKCQRSFLAVIRDIYGCVPEVYIYG